MTLQSRVGVNGVICDTTNQTVPLTDFIFQTAIATVALQQRHIRLEARSDFIKCGAPDFQIGPIGNSTLYIYIYRRQFSL